MKPIKKIFYQPRRAFSTTDPVAYPLKQTSLSLLMGWKPLSSLMYAFPNWRKKFTDLDINERIIEIPFILKNLPSNKKSNILDIGCCETVLPIQIASLGYKITGLDIRPYELTHPNLEFIQADICQNKIKKNKFELAICVSTLEHIGLDTIYGNANFGSSDKKALKEIFSLLKPNGRLLLTVPASKNFSQNEFMKIYTPAKLHSLLKDFVIVEERYFAPTRNRTNWQECLPSNLPTTNNFGVATIIAQKKR